MANPHVIKSRASSVSYACAVNPNVYFYTTQSEDSPLFILPQTYYVKIISKGESFCYVQYLENVAAYKALYGYCKTDELLFVDYTPERPFLYLSFDKKYVIEDGTEGYENGLLSSITYSCVYYGDHYVNSKRYSYVLINGVFGYVPQPQAVEYELNDDFIQDVVSVPADSPSIDTSDPKGNTDFGIIVLLVVLLSLVATGIFVVAVKPNRKKSYYYEE